MQKQLKKFEAILPTFLKLGRDEQKPLSQDV